MAMSKKDERGRVRHIMSGDYKNHTLTNYKFTNYGAASRKSCRIV